MARFEDAPAETAGPALSNAPSKAAALDTPEVTSAPVGFTRRLAQSHLERAEAFELRGDIALALHEYSACIFIDSTLGVAYLRLGALRERMGDRREADLVYSQAARLADTRAQALLQRAHLRRGAGLGAQALNDLESAALLDDSRAVLEELAQAYVELHAWSAALAVFRRIAASAAEAGDAAGQQNARLEVRALRVLAAETDPSQQTRPPHDWVSGALRSIARR
jgi:tetratricopeptide (TPR) repeat protein